MDSFANHVYTPAVTSFTPNLNSARHWVVQGRRGEPPPSRPPGVHVGRGIRLAIRWQDDRWDREGPRSTALEGVGGPNRRTALRIGSLAGGHRACSRKQTMVVAVERPTADIRFEGRIDDTPLTEPIDVTRLRDCSMDPRRGHRPSNGSAAQTPRRTIEVKRSPWWVDLDVGVHIELFPPTGNHHTW